MHHGSIAALLCLGLCACSGDREVRTYDVPKTSAGPVAAGAPAVSNANSGSNLTWQTPKSWKDKGPSDMRLASYAVESAKGSGDASIVVLGGEAGGIAANVNRWRGQVGLGALDEQAVLKSGQSQEGALGKFQVFDIQPGGGKSGILAAIFPLAARSVFVKLTGTPEFLRAEKGSFLAFCRSLREAHAETE